MFRLAVPTSLVSVASGFAGVVKGVAALFGRGRPPSAAALNDRMLQDIGLNRHDLWADGRAPQFRTMADVAPRAGWNEAAGRRG